MSWNNNPEQLQRHTQDITQHHNTPNTHKRHCERSLETMHQRRDYLYLECGLPGVQYYNIIICRMQP